MDSQKLRVAIIGSGVSGLVAIKSCKEEGELFAEIVCFERSASLGGLWKYREETENDEASDQEACKDTVSVMHGTIANSSKEMSAFSDFPPPPHTPNFMHHRLMYNYILSYARHFDVIKHIQFNSYVREVSRSTNQWKLTVITKSQNNNRETRDELFDALLIGTGHHGKPVIPTFNGRNQFEGESRGKGQGLGCSCYSYQHFTYREDCHKAQAEATLLIAKRVFLNFLLLLFAPPTCDRRRRTLSKLPEGE